MNPRAPIPTLGYPSKNAAIIALYEDHVLPRTIAERANTSVNVVHRAIHDYRAKTGRHVVPLRPDLPPVEDHRPQGSNVWARDEDDRRRIFHRRAVKAARQARMAQG